MMKSKYIFSLLLLITLLSFFSSCKSTPQPIQDSSISTKKEEIKKDGELDKKEKEALAARNEAIENEADKKFTSMFEAADKRLDIARKEKKREQAIKGFDEAITMYNTLTNLSKALQCKKELEELGFLDKEPEKIKKANELYDSASEKYQKDGKASLKDSSDSLSIYETLCDKAYFNLVGNIREAAKKAKEKCDSIKASRSMTEEYNEGVKFYNVGSIHFKEKHYRKSYKSYNSSLETFEALYTKVAEKRKEAEKALARAKAKLQESSSLAGEADAASPLQSAKEGFGNVDASSLENKSSEKGNVEEIQDVE